MEIQQESKDNEIDIDKQSEIVVAASHLSPIPHARKSHPKKPRHPLLLNIHADASLLDTSNEEEDDVSFTHFSTSDEGKNNLVAWGKPDDGLNRPFWSNMNSGLHHRHPTHTPERNNSTTNNCLTTTHTPRSQTRSHKRPRKQPTRYTQPVPWSPYRGTVTRRNKKQPFPLLSRTTRRWMKWLAAMWLALWLILVWSWTPTPTTNVISMFHLEDFLADQSVALANNKKNTPQKLARQRRPPAWNATTHLDTIPPRVNFLDPTLDATRPQMRRPSAWAPVERLCGTSAQQSSLQDARYFPEKFSLLPSASPFSARSVVVIGGGRLALKLAQALQMHCQVHVSKIVIFDEEKNMGDSSWDKLGEEDYFSTLLHEEQGPQIVWGHNTDWHSHYHAHHHDTAEQNETPHPVSHVVYFAPSNNRRLTFSRVSQMLLSLRKLFQLQRDEHLLVVQQSSSHSSRDTMLWRWMTETLRQWKRPHLVRARVPSAETLVWQKENKQTDAPTVLGEHVLNALVAAMQLDVAAPGMELDLRLPPPQKDVSVTTEEGDNHDSTLEKNSNNSSMLAERYLGGWTPQLADPAMCEWCTKEESDQSCASECSLSSRCAPSIWPVRLLQDDITQECTTVLYTALWPNDNMEGRGHMTGATQQHWNHSSLPHAEYDPHHRICNLAFVPRDHTLATMAVRKVPNEQLRNFGVHADHGGGPSIHEQTLTQLNGRLLYRGWILVWPQQQDPKQQTVDDEEWVLLKLAPGRLWADTVQYGVYVQNSVAANITKSQVQALVGQMTSEAVQARIVKQGPKRFLLPPEPARKAVLLVSQLAQPAQGNHAKNQRHHFSVRDATKVLLQGLKTEPHAVKQHREVYHSLGKWINGVPGNTPPYRYELESNLVETSVLVHDFSSDQGRELRCDWYQQHLAFLDSGLDALTLAHILALWDRKRKQAWNEPNDHERHHLQATLELKRQFTNEREWMPLLPILNQTSATKWWAASRYQFPLAPWDFLEQEEVLTLANQMAQEQGSPDNKGAAVQGNLFVRIIADRAKHAQGT